ncbi:MAG: hypothetical protein ABL956_05765 [Hyphomonadaceae bacterium]
MDANQHMGALYRFSLNDKLTKITEPSSWYSGADTPWKRAITPFEMISALLQYVARQDGLDIRGPAVGLFAYQEIRLIKRPLFVGEDYEIEREIVALTGSRWTESYWTRTFVYHRSGSEVIASMLLNQTTLKESYARDAEEHAQTVRRDRLGKWPAHAMPQREGKSFQLFHSGDCPKGSGQNHPSPIRFVAIRARSIARDASRAKISSRTWS